MALVRCPQCGRVADGVNCFACGHEWAREAVVPPATRPGSFVVPADRGPVAAAPQEEIDLDMEVDMDVAAATPAPTRAATPPPRQPSSSFVPPSSFAPPPSSFGSPPSSFAAPPSSSFSSPSSSFASPSSSFSVPPSSFGESSGALAGLFAEPPPPDVAMHDAVDDLGDIAFGQPIAAAAVSASTDDDDWGDVARSLEANVPPPAPKVEEPKVDEEVELMFRLAPGADAHQEPAPPMPTMGGETFSDLADLASMANVADLAFVGGQDPMADEIAGLPPPAPPPPPPPMPARSPTLPFGVLNDDALDDLRVTKLTPLPSHAPFADLLDFDDSEAGQLPISPEDKQLGDRVGVLAAALEAEGRITDATLLYEVQAALSGRRL